MRAVERSSETGISVIVFSVVELHFCYPYQIVVAFHGVLASMQYPIACGNHLQEFLVLSTSEMLNLSLHIAVKIVLLLFFQKIRYFNRSHLGKIFRNGSHPSEIDPGTIQNLQRLGSFDVIAFQCQQKDMQQKML